MKAMIQSEAAVIFSELACVQMQGDTQHKIGVITLNAPRTLNALTRDMVQAIQYRLDVWLLDPRIVLVWIESSQTKAFCAGGDVRALYVAGREKREGPAARFGEAFFTEEYRLDYTLHVFPKPVIGWGEGIVMGGGMGLLQGCRTRIVTESSRLAMPEISIALFPDVGASHFLHQVPRGLGRFLGLTGAPLGAADALWAGWADACLPGTDRQVIKEGLTELRWSPSSEVNQLLIDAFLAGFTAEPELARAGGPMAESADILAELVAADNTTVEVVNALSGFNSENRWLAGALDTLKAGSPLAACVIDQQWQRSDNLPLREIFLSELVLATNMVQSGEFYEGVRALLIDKDRRPRWQYRSVEEVPNAVVEAMFVPPWALNPLADLPCLSTSR